MHIVLVGAGHTHVGVLKTFLDTGCPAARITLVSPGPTLYYSGMLPAHVAGHYAREALAIDARGLLADLGATYVAGQVTGLDPERRTLTLADGTTLVGDILSLDIGTAPSQLAEANPQDVIPVKPVERLLAGLDRFERRLATDARARRLAVIGGGAGGVELSLSLAYRYRAFFHRPSIDLYARSGVMKTAPGLVRRDLEIELQRAGVNVHTGHGVTAIEDRNLVLENGARRPADTVIAATGARAPQWLADTGLACDEAGFVACDWSLRSCSHPAIFTAGDVAALPEPRPKSGVYAVRQTAVLAANLRHAAAGRALENFDAPRHALSLVSLGDRRALGLRGGLSLPPSRLLWRLKDRIDRGFVERHDRPVV